MHLTDHAYQRGKQRLGLNKAALEVFVKKVYHFGIPVDQTTGLLHSWLQKQQQKARDNGTKAPLIRVYGEHAYLWYHAQNGPCLITILHLPNSVKNHARQLMEQYAAAFTRITNNESTNNE